MRYLDLNIRSASIDDTALIKTFWFKVLEHTFMFQKSDEHHNPLDELDFKMSQFEHAMKSISSFYFLAFKDEKLIGTIAYETPPNRGILRRTNNELVNAYEIGSLYIEPSMQKQGYGKKILSFLLNHIKAQGIDEVCFDSILEESRKLWLKIFGEPRYQVKSIEHDFVHYIWVIEVDKAIKLINQNYHYTASKM